MNYLIVAGFVYSADGDEHKVGGPELAQLYGLNPQADNVRYFDSTRPVFKPFSFYKDWVKLYPRGDGKYFNVEELTPEELSELTHSNY